MRRVVEALVHREQAFAAAQAVLLVVVLQLLDSQAGHRQQVHEDLLAAQQVHARAYVARPLPRDRLRSRVGVLVAETLVS